LAIDHFSLDTTTTVPRAKRPDATLNLPLAILTIALLSVASGRFALGTVLVARGLEVTSFVLVRVTSWIVPLPQKNKDDPRSYTNQHEPKCFRIEPDAPFEAKPY